MNSVFNIKPNLLEKTIFRKKIAERVLKEELFPRLKKFPQSPKSSVLKSILHVNTAAGKGGAAKIAHQYLNTELNKAGFNSKILVNETYCENNCYVELLTRSNITLHKLLHKYSRSSGLLDFFNLSSLTIPELKSFITTDIVHLHNLHGAYFSPFALPEITALKPVIWTLHDEQSFTGHCAFSFDCNKWQNSCGNCPNLNFYPKLKKDTTSYLLETKKKIYECSNFTVVCPSKWLAERVKKSILSDKEVRVIYNGINEHIFVNTNKNLARQKLNLPQDKRILMFSASGSLDNPQKGGEYLLEIYERLKNRDDLIFLNIGGTNTKLQSSANLIATQVSEAGASKDYDKQFSGKTERLAVTAESNTLKAHSCNKTKSHTNWLNIPYVKDENLMAMYYSASDVFIYTSQAESFGLVVAEAMSCETPVVAFNNTALPELIKHNETGYLANNKSADDFISGLETLLNSEELRYNMGKNSRELILRDFTLKIMLNNYINLYKEKLST